MTINLSANENEIKIIYDDGGNFNGDENKIGKLFYTHHQTRGSGIGLYLSKKLTILMNGKFEISTSPNFFVTITLPVKKEGD